MRGGGMIMLTTVLVVTLVAVTAVSSSDQEAEKAVEASREIADQKVEMVLDGNEESPDPDRKSLEEPKPQNKFLFGSYSTTIYTNYVLSTSTVFYSCLAGTVAGTVCTGGRRRRKALSTSNINMDSDEEESSIPVVSSTIDDEYDYHDPSTPKPEEEPREKFAFTIWTTSRLTSSLTVLFTNSSTTVRLSYYCSIGLISYPIYNC